MTERAPDQAPIEPQAPRRGFDVVKRLLDVLIGGLGLVALTPVMIVLAVLVRMRLGAPVLFRQTRAGLHGRPFEMIKFRTMRDAVDASGRALPDEERLTPFSLWLRSTSLDELPELWNVVKGDMSLVGPRPLLMDYLPLYSPQQARRHEVPPGVTGWAQVNGRNAIGWDEKFALDVEYVERRSLYLDFKILLLTVKKVVRSEGVSPTSQVIMERFRGSAK